MNLAEVRQKYLDFFKARGHAEIPSASLVPENDPTTLFTGSGMQPLVPYLLGQTHPKGKRLTDSQKSFRADDIEEVGDNRHTTFFEMLGNWSLGDYWKEDQLPWFFEFLTKEIGLDPERLYVTVFSGGEGIDRDEEAIGIWKKLFGEKSISAEYVEMNTEAEASEKGMQPGQRIFGFGVKKNWWSRAGVPSNMPVGEPGGPDSEVFFDFDPTGAMHDPKFGKFCHPNCDCGRFMEIGNSVFMEYKKLEGGTFEKLKQRNVDFGGGLERITAASNGDPDVFKIDIFENLWKEFESENGIGWAFDYFSLAKVDDVKRILRIIADHLRAAGFLINDGVEPANKGRGYILRRLLRRAVFYMGHHKRAAFLKENWLEITMRILLSTYSDAYPDLIKNIDHIINVANKEAEKFEIALNGGLREFEKFAEAKTLNENAFNLYQNFGFPWEMTYEIAQLRGLNPDKTEFQKQFEIHREKSRTSSAGTFKGGLADHSEQTTKLHTAHHLLLKALQIVLGPHVKQRGSNITSERLRLDFSNDAKMTDEQKGEVERIVNEKIAEDLPVIRSELAREEAEKLGAEHEFGQKYPDRVSVYSIGPKSATQENPEFEKAFSIEFCGGPHVDRTGKIGKFKLVKEEAVSAGIRRVRATIE